MAEHFDLRLEASDTEPGGALLTITHPRGVVFAWHMTHAELTSFAEHIGKLLFEQSTGLIDQHLKAEMKGD